nr:mannose-1-phosphate guanylyltransferase [Bacteroidales bacterium]
MKNHYCVIMSGGIGSRFWPASRSSYPKQFLDFFGTGRSLIQQTFDRIKKIVPVENIFVVTNQRYNELTLEQLPELKPEQILLEPCRRNTAPCIAYAAHHIHAINPNASMVVAPSDHLILKEEEFLNSLSNGLDFVSKHDALLTLGIKPNRPETGYGYIQASHQSLDGFTKVKAFTEKPNLELAKVFLESGDFYWNSGIFLWNVQSIIKAFNEFLPEVAQAFNNGLSLFNTEKEKAFIDEMFPSCPNISIDYGVMEKANNVYVQMGDFGWSDLGTWGSLHELSDKDQNGNSILKCNALCYDSHNNIITLPEGQLAVVHKMDGYIIASSGNVLMICKRENEQEIRQFVQDAEIKFGENFV